MYKRSEYQTIRRRLEEPGKFIQVVMGARQIGKSTVVKQVLKDLDAPFQFYSADNHIHSLERHSSLVAGCVAFPLNLSYDNTWWMRPCVDYLERGA